MLGRGGIRYLPIPDLPRIVEYDGELKTFPDLNIAKSSSGRDGSGDAQQDDDVSFHDNPPDPSDDDYPPPDDTGDAAQHTGAAHGNCTQSTIELYDSPAAWLADVLHSGEGKRAVRLLEVSEHQVPTVLLMMPAHTTCAHSAWAVVRCLMTRHSSWHV
jgi:hypothetical protein